MNRYYLNSKELSVKWLIFFVMKLIRLCNANFPYVIYWHFCDNNEIFFGFVFEANRQRNWFCSLWPFALAQQFCFWIPCSERKCDHCARIVIKKQGKKCSNEKFRRRLKLDQVKVLGKCYLYEYVSSFLRASTDVKHSPSVSHVSCGQISQWHFNRPAIESTTCLPINLRYGS